MDKKFIITTDSTCDAGRNYLEKLDVNFVYFNFNDETNSYFDEMREEQNAWFYQKMKEGTIFKTSQININQYYDFFLNESKKGYPIIHISICEGISNSVNNARLAALNLKSIGVKVYVVDSTVGCLGTYLAVKKAYQLQQEGKDIEETLDILNENNKKIRTYFTTDDLTYFARGGRVSKGKFLISKLLHISVILNTDEVGHLKIVDIARGKKKAYKKILDKIKEEVVNPSEQTLYLTQALNLEGATQLAEFILKEIPFKDYEIHENGPTVVSHSGPGVIALFYYGNDK